MHLSQTHKRVVALAALLSREYRCQKGEKVAILMRNRPDWVIVSNESLLALHCSDMLATASSHFGLVIFLAAFPPSSMHGWLQMALYTV